MEYQALYRRYRPRRFDEVIGQDHITRTLSNEIVDGAVAHAYLFAGPRGTGKTSTARLLAKALNCTDLQADGEPCNECASCAAIDEGTSLDVIELDAASHNKVEDVRELRSNVGAVASVEGAHRIYILDEAHMLSRAAGNALLKTLEEPPEHVIFVLATTEPYKLLDTIRSRAQRFDFHPIPGELLVAHLEAVAAREAITVAPDAAEAIAAHAKGSARDALGLLEQVAALTSGSVAAADVSRTLGIADRDALRRILDASAAGDAATALTVVGELAAQGADLRRLVVDLLGMLRGAFLSQHVASVSEIADATRAEVEDWRSAGEQLTPALVLRGIDLLGDALTALREGREERLVVELVVMKLARPETDESNAALLARVEKLERMVATQQTEGVADAAAARPVAPPARAPKARPAAEPGPTSVAEPAEEGEEEEVESSAVVAEIAADPAPAAEVGVEAVAAAWPAILHDMRDSIGMRSHALLREAIPTEVRGGIVAFTVPPHLVFHLEQLRADAALAARVAAAISAETGSTVTVEFEAGNGDAAPEPEQPVASGPVSSPEALLKEQLGATELKD